MGTKTPLGRIRAKVCERANGECECCGAHVGFDGELGHLDHFWGRKHAAESVENCWLLCITCDADKTANRPRAAWWLTRFAEFASVHGFTAETDKADTRLAVLAQKFPERDVA